MYRRSLHPSMQLLCYPLIGFDVDSICVSRFQVIAQVIRKNGGAVVAEQLAPYLDAPPPQDTNAYAFSGSNALSGVVRTASWIGS